MAKYTKGDVYRFTNSTDCSEYSEGDVVTITEDGDYPYYAECSGHDKCLELVKKANEGDNMSETINVAAAIRDSDLTENQRIMREQGLVDDCGSITGAGQQAIWALLLKDKEDELVMAIKTALKATDTKAKK